VCGIKIADNGLMRDFVMSIESTEKEVMRCLQDNYRLKGSLQRLAGENLNYLVSSENGVRHVAKIVGEDMPAQVVEMEFAAIQHAVSKGFPLDLPEIIQNKFGNIETGIKIHINKLHRLRLISFIDGCSLDDKSDISDILIKNLGIALAGCHLTMQGFDHPAAHRNHRWNLEQAGQHRDKIRLLADPGNAELMTWGFDAWERVKGSLDSMPRQFIHGDMNPENILVDGDRVTGLVDFGDACFNPRVCELAICLTYLMMDKQDPLQAVDIFTRAYREKGALTAMEQDALLPLVCGRLVTSIAVSTERRGIDPDNPNWFGGENSAWALLKTIKGYL
jgi:Ser/Thr protein kinase RdoA (MazF antagonist)